MKVDEKIEFCVIILHYLAFEMTIKSIDSILKVKSNRNIKIIVVDNASNNDTGIKLKKRYEDNKYVDIIINKTNLGFAKGNNVGYRYALKYYNPKFVIIMNNDVILKEKDFFSKIISIYERTRFDVLGPDIYNPYTKNHQSPAHLKGFSKEELEELALFYSREKNISWLRYMGHQIKNKLFKCKKDTYDNAIGWNIEQYDCVLHGACYIFSKRYLELNADAFYSKTFLYFEEDILHYICLKSGFKQVYSPYISVEHFEDVSTNMVSKSKYKRVKAKNCYMLESINYFIELMSK